MPLFGWRCFSVSKASFFTCLVLLLASASGNAAQHKPLLTEELEKYNNPPMIPWRTGLSPRMLSQFGAFTSFQVNVAANDHYDPHNEISQFSAS